MSADIRIELDGPAIRQTGQLSLAAMGPALRELLSAARYTASAIIRDSVSAEYGARGGKLHKAAHLIDVELTSIAEGSVMIGTQIVSTPPKGPQVPLDLNLDTLPDRVSEKLISDIDAESNGRRVNARVRKYLAKIPPGISQRYTYKSPLGDRTVSVAATTETTPAAEPRALMLSGIIASIGFIEPRRFVEIRSDGTLYRCQASDSLVARALTLRPGEVTAVAVRDVKATRLIRLDPVGRPMPAAADRTKRILEGYKNVLAELAK